MALVDTYFPEGKLFHDLKAMGRQPWSYEGACALQDYLDEESNATIEYDPIGFVCEFDEILHEDMDDVSDRFPDAPVREDDDESDKDYWRRIIDYLNNQTLVIEHERGIMFAEF